MNQIAAPPGPIKFASVAIGWNVAVPTEARPKSWRQPIPRVQGEVIEKDDPARGSGMVRIKLVSGDVVEKRASDLLPWDEWHTFEAQRQIDEARAAKRAERLRAERAENTRIAAEQWEAERPAREAEAERLRIEAEQASERYTALVTGLNERLSALGTSGHALSTEGDRYGGWEDPVEAARDAGYYVFAPQELADLLDRAAQHE